MVLIEESMKSQNCPNLSMAMKALLFVFSNTVIRLSFLCAFLSSSISAKEDLLYFLQHNADYVSNEASFSCRIIFGNYLGGKVARSCENYFWTWYAKDGGKGFV